MAFYVHRIITEGEFEKIDLIGPFSNNSDAADWGATFCAPGGPDDPRWNVVDLDDVDQLTEMDDNSICFLVPVSKPTGTVAVGAYKSGHEFKRYGEL